LFSGADFALIPSRDEPFGLVAVEFGRKGALGVGARLGGLGLMPGWVSGYRSAKNQTDIVVVPCRVERNGTHAVAAHQDYQARFEID
jgi:hypothetical protein